MLFTSFSVDGLILAISVRLSFTVGAWPVLAARLALHLLFARMHLDDSARKTLIISRYVPALLDLTGIFVRTKVYSSHTLWFFLEMLVAAMSPENVRRLRRDVRIQSHSSTGKLDALTRLTRLMTSGKEPWTSLA